MTDPYQILKKDFFEVICVGGGTCGLAAAARLCEDYPGSIYTEDEHQRFHWLKQRGNKVNLINRNVSSRTKYKSPNKDHIYRSRRKFLPQELLVLDAVAGRFMGQWDNQFASCQIPFLRSPMFFHPDPVNIDGMVSFAHLHSREGPKDLMEIQNVVGKEYSKHQLKKVIAKHTKKHPVPNNDSEIHDRPGIIDINMRDWKDYYRPSTRFFHDFCQDLVNRYELSDRVKKDEVVSIEYREINVIDTNEVGKGFIVKTQSGSVYGCKFCICASGHRGNLNYPIKALEEEPRCLEGSCHTSHLFNKKVSFPHERVTAKIHSHKPASVIVVGGGLTSAQIAHVCATMGIKVYFLTRGPLKVKHFDFHLDWVTKYKNVKKSAFYIKDSDEERLQMIQDAREGGSVNPEYHKKLMKHVKAGRVKLMRFSQLKSTTWNSTTKSWDVMLETTKSETNNEDTTKEFEMMHLANIDYIYCATGITPDITGLPFLQSICKEFPIPTVKGLPCLTDNLQWSEEVPLFVIGKNASLRTGPSSANLDGARLGAERIGWFIQEERSKGAFDWTCCEHCTNSESLNSVDSDLDAKIDQDDKSLAGSSEDSSDEEADDAFSTRLKLASGQMNWYSILQEA